jgi:hypothetical protein
MGVMLVWEHPKGAVEFPLGGTATLTVGREEDADIQIGEPLVSRLHARLERRGGAWFLIDLGSTNLTRVNGAVVHEQELRPGDEVRFARARCRFVEAEAATTPCGPAASGGGSSAADGETPRSMPAPSSDGPSS